MTEVRYRVVEHDGGWAYQVADVFSEAFPTHAAALAAARAAAIEQRRPGSSTGIQYQDQDGNWHEELAKGDDRPDTIVQDA